VRGSPTDDHPAAIRQKGLPTMRTGSRLTAICSEFDSDPELEYHQNRRNNQNH